MVFTDSTPREASITHRRGKIIVRPEYRGRIGADSFRPEAWGERARAVTEGGRGGAWFVQDGTDSWVLRQYRRGGLIARLSERSYWFTSEQAVRGVAEFRLLSRLYDKGLPVPKPVATHYNRISATRYQAEILLERIPGAATFAAGLSSAGPDLWYRAGQLVREFHDENVYHSDLNCHNILVTDDKLYLIDFDKSCIRPGGGRDARWKRKNLERLRRSVMKLLGAAGTAAEKGWQQFLLGYDSAGQGGLRP